MNKIIDGQDRVIMYQVLPLSGDITVSPVYLLITKGTWTGSERVIAVKQYKYSHIWWRLCNVNSTTVHVNRATMQSFDLSYSYHELIMDIGSRKMDDPT